MLAITRFSRNKVSKQITLSQSSDSIIALLISFLIYFSLNYKLVGQIFVKLKKLTLNHCNIYVNFEV